MGNPMNVKKHLKQLVCPCKDCQKRHEKCHGSCDQYKNWDTEQKKLKAEMWKEWTIVNKKDTIFKYIFWERLDSLPIPECCFHFIWC